MFKTVCPLDIRLWQPFANDADCSYVGNTGWCYPSPPQVASFGLSGSFTTTWAANVLTTSAVPSGTVTTVTGPDFVRTTDTTRRWGIRAMVPSASVALSYMGNMGASPAPFWSDIANGLPVSASSRIPPTLTQAITVYKPVTGTADMLVDQCLSVSYFTSWGFNIAHMNPYQRTTLPLT